MPRRRIEKIARRVPVEHLKIDPPPAALDGNRREPRHQLPPDALPARGLGDVKSFEIHPRPAEPGRKPRMKHGEAGGRAIAKGEDRLELPVRPEPVTTQIVLGRDDRTRRLFKDRKLADKPQH